MKRLIISILSAALLLSLCACGNSDSGQNSPTIGASSPQQTVPGAFSGEFCDSCGITLSTAGSTYRSGTKELVCDFYNGSDSLVPYTATDESPGPLASLILSEKDGVWYPLPGSERSFDWWSPPEGGGSISVDIAGLTEGTYRCVFEMCGPGKYHYAEFTVSDSANSDYVNYGYDESGFIRMYTEYPVYAPGMERISYFIENNGNSDAEYGDEYQILKQDGDKWWKIFPVDDATWNSILNITSPGKTSARRLNIATLGKGTYRIVKQINGQPYYAEFSIGESSISPETPYGFEPQSALPEDYGPEAAASKGDLVNVHGEILNPMAFDRFISNITAGAPAFLRLTQYTIEGDPIICDLEYTGEFYRLTTDNSRDAFGIPNIREEIYSYLISDGESLFLSDCVDYSIAEAAYGGIEDNAAYLTSALPEWAEAVAELCKQIQEWNVTTMRRWNSDGSICCTLDSYGDLACMSPGSGSMLFVPDDVQEFCGNPLGLFWLDESRFALVTGPGDSGGYPYQYFVFDALEQRFIEHMGGDGHMIEDGELYVAVVCPEENPRF